MDREKRRAAIRFLETPIFKINNINKIKAEKDAATFLLTLGLHPLTGKL